MTHLIWIVVFCLLLSCQNKPNEPNAFLQIKKKPIPQILKKNDKDGAPEGPIPVHFETVKPVSEPLSRYGNLAEYKVNGETYEVMTNARGYKARGVASWYGTKFHQRLTSSGEEYDLYALTAAHKTLPLPTYVKVKNLSNGKFAIVKVNDRGPFHDDRLIDLSYGAAAKLGLLPKGTAPVEIEALTTGSLDKTHAAQFYLQVGAFSKQELAESLHLKLAALTHSPVMIEKYKDHYIVTAGPFIEKTVSDQLKVSLANSGITGAFTLLK